MSLTYAIPKREVPVEICLRGLAPMMVKIFLSERAESHSGFERPSDLLNGSHAFLPAVDARGEVVLLNRDSLMVVSVAAEHEFGGEDLRPEDLAPDDVTRALVDVVLEDGSTIRGMATYLLPEAQRRLQDFLNMAERFLTLREAKLARLINKRRIARVSPV